MALPQVEDFGNPTLEPIAVIGYSFKFPQEAVTPEGFWDLLANARCVSTEFPEARINARAYYHPDYSRHDAFHFKGGHFLKEELDRFDAPFFSIKPAEAAAMDPHQRKLLEVSYRALENAGLPIEKVAGTQTSVFTASFADDYRLMTHRDVDSIPTYALTGTTGSFLANRISWFYDLRGVSMNVDTACSSSLVAVDQACQSLQNGASSMSIVTGGNIILDPSNMIGLSNLNFLSPDSRCFSFDARANGYAQGEGVGVVVLQRLSDAIRDGACIRAVIRSTGSNSDGRTTTISQPSSDAQTKLIRDTYRKAGLSLGHTRFFEAHATGTAQGDPIESSAIGAVFSDERDNENPLYIGAVKSNIGHLEGGSGIAGLIKTVMILEKGLIPPNANFESLNPKIDAKRLHFKFVDQVTPWPAVDIRRASINSFGFGGTNGHVVVEDVYNHLRLRGLKGRHRTAKQNRNEGPGLKPSNNYTNGYTAGLTNGHTNGYTNGHTNGHSHTNSHTNGHINGHTNGYTNGINGTKSTLAQLSPHLAAGVPRLLVWSAGDRGGVDRILESYRDHFRHVSSSTRDDDYLDDLSYTLSSRRSALSWRTYRLAASASDLDVLDGTQAIPTKRLSNPRLAFVFTGQGAQWSRMGYELLLWPVFRRSLMEATAYMKSLGSNWSILDELAKENSVSELQKPALSQPVCTAIQVALVDLLRSFDILPSAVVGHSSGEIGAAYAAGAISAKSSWKIAYYRGLLAEELSNAGTQGAMMSVGLSAEDVKPYLKSLGISTGSCNIVVACINSPSNVTLSGDRDQLQKLVPSFEEKGVFNRMLRVDVAYHSPHMIQLAPRYLKALGSLEPGDVSQFSCRMSSSVRGGIVSNLELRNPHYWVDNLTNPVRFTEAIGRMMQESFGTSKDDESAGKAISTILEVGPHAALQGPINECTKQGAELVEYASTLRRSISDCESLLSSIGKLWSLGHHVNVEAVNKVAQASSREPQLLVDLPAMPFDESRKYWPKSLVSDGYQFRGQPRNDLLGTRVPDWNPLDAKWRNVIKLSELGWVAHHVVNGAILYPGAGMIVMAIEAARQTSDSKQKVRGFEVRNVMFQQSIFLREESPGVEISFTLRRLKARRNHFSSWSEFILSSCQEGKWIENCRGIVKVELESKPEEYGNLGEAELELRKYRNELNSALRSCKTSLQPEDMYKFFRETGLKYGPSFQLLDEIKSDTKDEAVSKVRVFQDSQSELRRWGEDHVVHPTTLDAYFHLLYVTLTEGCTKYMPTSVPTTLRRLWIANDGLCSSQAKGFIAHTKRFRPTSLLDRFSLFAVDSLSGELRLVTEGLEVQAVAHTKGAGETDGNEFQQFYRMEWKPDVSMMAGGEVAKYVQHWPDASDDFKDFYNKLTLLLLMFITQTLNELTDTDVAKLPDHLRKYVAWMQRTLAEFEGGVLPNAPAEWKRIVSDSNLRVELADEIEVASAQGRLFVQTGRNLLGILRGTVNVHELFFNGPLVEEFYEGMYAVPHLKHAYSSYLDALAHKDPTMRILEVGAGTGGASVATLQALSSSNEDESRTAPRYQHYEYTDVSPSFFERARKRFPEHLDRMSFKLFDVGKDPVTQGLDATSYDIVLAFGSIHITHDLAASIRHARKLLKPGGKLILGEITQPDILRSSFAFGLFPGWWLSLEDYRKWGPSVSENKWHELLTQNGFSGTDLVLHDHERDDCQEVSVIVSTALDEKVNGETEPNGPEIRIVAAPESVKQMEIVSRLQLQLALAGHTPRVMNWRDISKQDAFEQDVHIFLVEYENPFLHELDLDNFNAMKSMFVRMRNILWITGGGGNGTNDPGFGAIDGLSRSLRNENGSLKIITLALETLGDCFDRHTDHILQCLETKIFHPLATDEDQEYVEKSETLGINRLIQAETLQNQLVRQRGNQATSLQKIALCPPIKLSIRNPGLLGSLEFIEERIHEDLAVDEVEIRVEAVGITIVDCLAVMGRYREGWIGGECAGTVIHAGISSGFNIGDQVAFVGLDKFATRARSRTAVKFGTGLSFAEAASIPVSFTIAWLALIETARITMGESVLITHGACGVGQACIQIARYSGAEVFVTVNSAAEKKALLETFDVAPERIFSHQDLLFAKGVVRLNGGQGVDVVLNALDEDGTAALWDCVAPFGRFVEVGPDAKSDERRLRLAPQSSVSYSTTNLRTLLQVRPKMAQDILRKVTALISTGQLQTTRMLYTYSASNVEGAFRDLLDRQNAGKCVVTFEDQAIVKCALNSTRHYDFDCNATYLISGGFGTCGRILSHWMADRGVRYLVLLSRSGDRHNAEFIESLRKKGVYVDAPPCDISDRNSIKPILDRIKATMPPIKGAIQAATVIKDSLLEKMPFEEWDYVIGPKVRGSWNLHELLPAGMDFFIMLSSMAACVGFGTQTNYSTGNTYQDALARYRQSIGERAVSLNLGPVDFDSPYSRDPRVKEIIFQSGFHLLQPPNDLCDLIDYFCFPRADSESQILMGINDPASIRALGKREPEWMHRPLFKHFYNRGNGESSQLAAKQLGGQVDVVSALTQAASVEEAGAVVTAALIQRLSSILSIEPELLDENRPMHAYGVDSLVAVDIRNWIAKDIRADLAIFDILGAASMKDTGMLVAGRSKYRLSK
ncbi:MAG: Type I Iterative PKS [Bogoriella megaspora]|nr:MAG: Type I Iterative PKS [Bogoriella megaspora]